MVGVTAITSKFKHIELYIFVICSESCPTQCGVASKASGKSYF